MSHPRKTNGKGENKNCKTKKYIKVTRGPNNDIGRAFGLGRWRYGGGKRARRKSTWMTRGNGRQKRFPYCPPIAREFHAPLLGGPPPPTGRGHGNRDRFPRAQKQMPIIHYGEIADYRVSQKKLA